MVKIHNLGEIMAVNLFGTDGIRGEFAELNEGDEVALSQLTDNRIISPQLLKLLGECLGKLGQYDVQPTVVIGWDDRPGNQKLASSLTVGLNLSGCKVVHIGICATPTLHYLSLKFGAIYGCMITASHNPASDSGLKIFDDEGFKTTPEFELSLSKLMYDLSMEDREIDDVEAEQLKNPAEDYSNSDLTQQTHSNWLTTRVSLIENLMSGVNPNNDLKIANPLLIDSSRGFACSWFANWLTHWGIVAQEVSLGATELNLHCGAGEFSPTDSWTIEEATQSPHCLLNRLQYQQPGTLVGAAFDGDGDRCLLITTTEDGYAVIDGDNIADTILGAVTINKSWNFAASIESDLSLTTNLERYDSKVSAIETAVGDRWLSFALKDSSSTNLAKSISMPTLLGVEDSGHLVLASPHPNIPQKWTLVGDGIMTLMAYLVSIKHQTERNKMVSGWKKRQSVSGVDRSKWNGHNALSDKLEQHFRINLNSVGSIENWQRSTVSGEPNLMMLSCLFNSKRLSIGIRNSGTQAKISVSARLESGADPKRLGDIVSSACDILQKSMTIQ